MADVQGYMETTEGERIPIPIKDEPKITIEIRSGRWGKIFHLFDGYGGEVRFPQKDAVRMAKQILKEQNK